MKYCPLCDKSYDDQAGVCEVDGALLREAGEQRDPLIGSIIKERYRIIEKVGEGGMGTVYLAEQVSVGRKVALKILHPEFARDQEFVKRFRQEARLAASLNHRSVIKVFDFDQGEDGSLFIAMEYVDGRRLKEVIQVGSLSFDQAIRLGIQIAEGLRAAHRAGVIHRDIKPENIMVVGEQANEVKLMDFGIARLRDTGASTRLTRSGMIMGTPAYMAPEQIQGQDVSQRTDIYAFGVVLYEMLGGDVPFKAPTPSAVLLKHLQEMPAPLRKLRKEIPTQVELVVMKTLEKEPDKRQADMQEVIEGLKKAQQEVVPRPEKPQEIVRPQSEEEQPPNTLLTTQLLTLETAGGSTNIEGLKNEHQVPKTLLATQPLDLPRRTGIRLPGRKFLGISALVVLLGGAGVMGGRYLFRQLDLSKPQPLAAPQAKIVSLMIRAGKEELKTTESTGLRIQARYSDGREQDISDGVQWQSSDPSVVAVSSKGEVEGQNPGSASITARYSGMVAPPVMLMVKAKEPELPAAPPVARLVSLTVRAEKSEIKVKERAALSLEGKYSDGKVTPISRGVEWRSSNRATAAVNSKGEVTAKKEGKVNITARHAGMVSSPLILSVKG